MSNIFRDLDRLATEASWKAAKIERELMDHMHKLPTQEISEVYDDYVVRPTRREMLDAIARLPDEKVAQIHAEFGLTEAE